MSYDRYLVERKIVGPNYIVTVEHDDDAGSPADWDNYGTLVHCHSRYAFGDERVSHEALQEICEDKNNIWLPVYMYDHSGVTINTSGFSCSWDSGQVGVIYITKEDARKQGHTTGKVGIQKIYECLKGTVESWAQFMEGRVYGYRVYQVDLDHPDCPEDLDEITRPYISSFCDEVHSCWGFYGESDYCLSEGVAEAQACVAHDEKAAADTVLAAAKESEQVCYWAARDVMTVANGGRTY